MWHVAKAISELLEAAIVNRGNRDDAGGFGPVLRSEAQKSNSWSSSGLAATIPGIDTERDGNNKSANDQCPPDSLARSHFRTDLEPGRLLTRYSIRR